jgi:dihydroorotase
MQAAVAGGVTSLVCPPVPTRRWMNRGSLRCSSSVRKPESGAGLSARRADARSKGERLTARMAELRDAGCVGYGQADMPIMDNQVLAAHAVRGHLRDSASGCVHRMPRWAEVVSP